MADESRRFPGKVGVALGSGAAKGWAHIGVIRGLVEHGIVPDVVCGTSMGAVVGALYASGLSADQVREKLFSVDWDSTLRDVTDRNERSTHAGHFWMPRDL